MTYDEALKTFKPEFGNMRHVEAGDVLRRIRATENRIALAIKRDQRPAAAEKVLKDLQKRFVAILSYGTK